MATTGPAKHSLGADDNLAATCLMLNANPASPDWGWAPPRWQQTPGTAIVTRVDGQDLHREYALSLASYCLDSMQMLFEASLENEISRQEVLDAMTRQAMDAARQEDRVYEAHFKAAMSGMSLLKPLVQCHFAWDGTAN